MEKLFKTHVILKHAVAYNLVIFEGNSNQAFLVGAVCLLFQGFVSNQSKRCFSVGPKRLDGRFVNRPIGLDAIDWYLFAVTKRTPKFTNMD